MLATKVQDNTIVKVGDYVSFKSDYEQCGKVTKIARGMFGGVMLTLYREDGFEGDYLRGADTTVQNAEDCWVE